MPDLGDPERTRSAVPQEFYDLVSAGHPEQNMPAFMDLLSESQRRDVTAYLFTLPVTREVYEAGAAVYDLVGRALGRRPFFPSISPRKTLEGALGGLAVGTLGALAAAAIVAAPAPLWKVLVLGLAIGVAAPLGDLAESVIKRQTGAKDAGRLIPGHGGMLDRLDSLIFVGPLTYYVVTLWMQAG